MLDLRSCPVCGKLTDAQEKTCPHCGTEFAKKPVSKRIAFEPPEPVPVERPRVSREVSRPLPAQKAPVMAEPPLPAPPVPAAKTGSGDPGQAIKLAVSGLLPYLIIIAVILVAAIAVLPYLVSLGDSWGRGVTPPGGSQETYTGYSNPSLGFSVQYPESWTCTVTAEPGTSGITDVKFASSDKNSGLLVQVADASGTAKSTTLDEWAKGTVTVLGAGRQDFTLIANERTAISGNPAQKYEFTWVMNSGLKMRSVVFLTIKGSKVYNIAFVTTESRAADTSDMQQRIFGSFVLS